MTARARLKLYRRQHGLSVVDLAEKLDCSYQFIYALESEASGKFPSRAMGQRIYALTGIPDAAWTRIAGDKPRLKTA